MHLIRQLIDRLQQPNGWILAVIWYAAFASLAFMPLDQFTGIQAVGLLNVIGAMVAAVPLLVLAYSPDFDNRNSKPAKRFMPRVYLALLLWNILTTWWIWNSTIGGSIAAFTINALLQLLPWWAFRFTQRKTNHLQSLSIWTLGQVVWEYAHMHWDLSWSWLNLGNSLAFMPALAQWYTFIGTLGGSLWLWGIQAALAYLAISILTNEESEKPNFRFITYWTTIPIVISLFMYFTYSENSTGTVNVLALQPNVDPYTEKYAGGTAGAEQQVMQMIAQTDAALKPETQLILWPETAIPHPIMIDESQTESHPVVQKLKSWLASQHGKKNLTLLAGINTYKFIEGRKPDAKGNIEPDVFNSAIYVNANDSTLLYHKSKLVPGVEQLPYPAVFSFLSSLAIDLGGPVGSLVKQDYRTVFGGYEPGDYRVAPIICYESIYGNFCAGFSRNSANVLGIITNDAWWGETNGHRQHWAYARLRAIENRRWVVRSANTGISGIINSRGDILQQTSYNTEAAVTATVPLIEETSWYAGIGDNIGWFCLILFFRFMFPFTPIGTWYARKMEGK